MCKVVGGETPVLSCTLRDDRYGVLTEVLVIDKTRSTSYTVRNQEMIDRGGQCRRVLYTPGQSTWAAMRYTGEYQIAVPGRMLFPLPWSCREISPRFRGTRYSWN